MEKKLRRPLQCLICQLHLNELPFRHLFQKLDGRTNGPNGLTETLGKKLHRSSELKITNFVAIRGRRDSGRNSFWSKQRSKISIWYLESSGYWKLHRTIGSKKSRTGIAFSLANISQPYTKNILSHHLIL